MKAIEGNWKNIRHFLPREFPSGVLEHMSFSVIETLDQVRADSGVGMIPSPIAGAHVRHTKRASLVSDFHSTDEGKRLSTATDFFIRDRNNAFKVWMSLVTNPNIGGVGIYLDKMYKGKPTIMFHIDDRKKPLWWISVNNEFTYSTQGDKFLGLIGEING